VVKFALAKHFPGLQEIVQRFGQAPCSIHGWCIFLAFFWRVEMIFSYFAWVWATREFVGPFWLEYQSLVGVEISMGAKSGRFLADDLASGSVRSQLHGLKDAQEVFWHQNGTEQSFPLCFEYPNSGSLQCWSFVLLLGLSIFFSSQTRRYNNDIHYSKSTLDNVPIPTLCSP